MLLFCPKVLIKWLRSVDLFDIWCTFHTAHHNNLWYSILLNNHSFLAPFFLYVFMSTKLMFDVLDFYCTVLLRTHWELSYCKFFKQKWDPTNVVDKNLITRSFMCLVHPTYQLKLLIRNELFIELVDEIPCPNFCFTFWIIRLILIGCLIYHVKRCIYYIR